MKTNTQIVERTIVVPDLHLCPRLGVRRVKPDACHDPDAVSIMYQILRQKAMKNPKLVERRYIAKYGSFDGYKESFAYVFHEPEPERTEEDKQAEIRNLVKHAEALQKEIDGLAAAVDNVRNQADTLLRISHLIEKDMGK